MPTWLRCRDRETGHEFDLAPDDIRIAEDTVEVLKGYPENAGLTARPRPAKHRVDKAGQPLSSPPDSAEQPDGAPAPDDNPPAVTSANTRRSNSDG